MASTPPAAHRRGGAAAGGGAFAEGAGRGAEGLSSAGGTDGRRAAALPLWSPTDALRTLASVVGSPHDAGAASSSSSSSSSAAAAAAAAAGPAAAGSAAAGAAASIARMNSMANSHSGENSHAAANWSGDAATTGTGSGTKRLREIAPAVENSLTASPATTAAALTLVHKAAASLSRHNSTTSISPPPPQQQLSQDDEGMFPLDGDDGDDTYSRKEKSLALLCRNFSELFRGQENTEISLDTAARQLSVERRRIYDIVNVFESLDIMERLGKNRYRWNGLERITTTVNTLTTAVQRHAAGLPHLTDRLSVLATSVLPPPSVPTAGTNNAATPTGKPAGDSSSRREKSLGILCLRFVVLFLTSENNAISLADAATALLHDGDDDDDEENGGAGGDDDTAAGGDAGDSKSAGLAASVRSARYKTKVRRLYDIANILSALRMVSKVRQPGTHYSKPVFQWIGPYSALRPPLRPIPVAAAALPMAPAPAVVAAAPAPAPPPLHPARVARPAASPAAKSVASSASRPVSTAAPAQRSSPDTPMAVAALTKAANSTDNAAIRSLFADPERHPSSVGPGSKRRRTAASASRTTTADDAAAVLAAPLASSSGSINRTPAAAAPIKTDTPEVLVVPEPGASQAVWDEYFLNVRTAMARAYLENIRPGAQ